jgi:hypothetical protein
MNRRTKKWVLIAAVLIVLLAVAGAVIRSQASRLLTRGLLAGSSGIGIEVGEVDLRLFRRSLSVRDLHVKNPEGFAEPEALHIPRLDIGFTWSAILKKQSRFRLVDITLATITVVQPRNGPSNFEVLEAIILGTTADTASDAPPAGQPGLVVQASCLPAPPTAGGLPAGALPLAWLGGGRSRSTSSSVPAVPELRIDELRLHIGTIDVIDYTLGGPKPLRQTITLDKNYTYTDVVDLEPIVEQLTIEFTVNTISEALGVEVSETDALVDGIREIMDALKQPPATDGAPPPDVDDPEDQFLDVIEDRGE